MALLAWTAGAPTGAYASSCLPERSGYQVRSGRVFFVYRNSEASGEIATDIEATSLRSVSNPVRSTGVCSGLIDDYVRDRQRVYYRGKAITGADPESFEFINAWFAKDRVAVYGLDRRLTTRLADFRLIGADAYSEYATDGKRYFYNDTIFEGEGFESVPKTYNVIRTSTRVYFRGQALDVDPKTFEGLDPAVSMSRDKDRVYYRLTVVPDADPVTITQIKGYLWKDKRAVYLEGREILGLDPATARTFPIMGEYTADADSVFRLYDKLDRDPATFSVLQPWYTKDKAGVYHQDVLMPVADPLSFLAESMSNGQDKNYRFRANEIVCKINPEAAGTAPACGSPTR